MTRIVKKSNVANAELVKLVMKVKKYKDRFRSNLVTYELARIELALKELNYALYSAKNRPEITEEVE